MRFDLPRCDVVTTFDHTGSLSGCISSVFSSDLLSFWPLVSRFNELENCLSAPVCLCVYRSDTIRVYPTIRPSDWPPETCHDLWGIKQFCVFMAACVCYRGITITFQAVKAPRRSLFQTHVHKQHSTHTLAPLQF